MQRRLKKEKTSSKLKTYTLSDTIKIMNGKSTDREKIFAIHVSGKWLVSKFRKGGRREGGKKIKNSCNSLRRNPT